MKHIISGREITPKNIVAEMNKLGTPYTELIEKNTAISEADIALALTPDIILGYMVAASEEAKQHEQSLRQRLYTILSIAYPHAKNESHTLIQIAQNLPKVTSKMGRALYPSEQHVTSALAKTLASTLELHAHIQTSIENTIATIAPSITVLAGPDIAARLVSEAGSLEKLARLSASTIQVLGARKAVMRSKSTGAANPKHGIIYNHPYVRKSQTSGKSARVLADKIAIAARVDYFGGTPIGEKLKQQL